ncbi:hypothetical protein L596_016416 [Steinernema carpocapsae]|uniref:Uncharacterized protein n=1 Tax=Steinernema carpocapsae TaxID=34508 RepID=A0A4V6A3I1_STECR|nr:hypothetical protein L596_016416 [Steinernema carpocapsae]
MDASISTRIIDDAVSGSTENAKVLAMTEAEYVGDIKSEYAKTLENLSPENLQDNFNPGPNKPDGSVNFECHCVGHLVASPCGYEFRKAISCQKSASEEEMENGACAEELMGFMKCAMDTECFRARIEPEKKEPEPQSQPSNSEGK